MGGYSLGGKGVKLNIMLSPQRIKLIQTEKIGPPLLVQFIHEFQLNLRVTYFSNFKECVPDFSKRVKGASKNIIRYFFCLLRDFKLTFKMM